MRLEHHASAVSPSKEFPQRHIQPAKLSTRKSLLLIEFTLLYLGIPGAIFLGIVPVPKFVVLIAVCVVYTTVLLLDPSFSKQYLTNIKTSKHFLKHAAGRLGLSSLILLALTLILVPDHFLAFPKERTVTWIALGISYPVLSVVPQELLYRVFFFHRYYLLFEDKQKLILFSTLSFSFMHLIYHNLPAVLLTLFGGYFFSKTYNQTNSFIITCIEHAIYGYLLFTIGLGNAFFVGG